MAHDVFISYSSKDINVAHAVCAKFEQEGVRCWYAPRDISPGDEWASSIMTAIRGAKVLVLVFTDFSNASVQVRREVDNAISSGITIIPFKLTTNSPSGGMKYYLSTLHWLDAVDRPLEDAIDDLLEMVQNNLQKPEKADQVPERQALTEKKSFSGRQVIQLICGILLLIPTVVLLWIFVLNPTLNFTAWIVILMLGLLLFTVSCSLFLTLSRRVRKKRVWTACLMICVALFAAGIGKAVAVENHAPTDMTIRDKGPEVSMNMANYSFIVRTDDDVVYFADRVGGVDGIYRTTLQGFYDGEQGECILSGVLVDNLALSDNNMLFFRDITNDRMNLCVLDLSTGECKTLKHTTTSHYYSCQNFVLFYIRNTYVPSIDVVTSDGKYENTYKDGFSDRFNCYKGRAYFIGSSGKLSVSGAGTIPSIVSTDVTDLFIIYDDTIYYAGANGKGIYRAALDNPQEIERLSANEPWNMVICGEYLYYLNMNDNSSLYRISLESGLEEAISHKSYTALNVVGKGLYLSDSGISYDRFFPD